MASNGSPSALVERSSLAHQVLDALGSAVAVLDVDGHIRLTNRTWAEVSADPVDVIAGLHVGDDLLAACRSAGAAAGGGSPVDDHVADGIQRVLAGRAPRFELQHEVQGADGGRWFLLVVTAFPGGGAVVARTETTVHHSVHEVFADLAFHDPLTGLPNRWLVLDRLRMALGRAERQHIWATVVFADLDGFKAVNDRLGHAAGDKVLTTIGHRFHQALRSADTCGRWGGDEYVLVLEMEHPSHLPVIIARLNAAATAPIALDGDLGEVQVGVSLGVASVRGDVGPDTVVQLADEAMYRAKQEHVPVFCTIGGEGEPVFGDPAAILDD